MMLFTPDGEAVENANLSELELPKLTDGRLVGVPREDVGVFEGIVRAISRAGSRLRFDKLPVDEGDPVVFYVKIGGAKVSPHSAAIQRDAPPPPPRNRWPFGDMEVGDLVRFGDLEVGERARRYVHAYARNCRPGWKFTTRNIDGVVHVWRVK